MDLSKQQAYVDAQARPGGICDSSVMSCQAKMEHATIGHACGCAGASGELSSRIMRLQLMTLVWMLIECALALVSAWRARSPVLLAFGADSLIELLSALVVLLQFVPWMALSTARATKLAGILLFILAAVIAITSGLALWRQVQPNPSLVGMGVTIAGLIVMPMLSSAKRRAGKTAGNRALTADAVQSATCAYLAGITLTGLVFNALLHIRWIDPAAALFAIPIICIEGKKAFEGEACC